MMSISIEHIKELRKATGAGVMEVKSALEQSGGDLDEAKKILFEAGLQKASKRLGHESSQGTVATYIHGGGQIGVIVELKCETDFTSRTDGFQALAREIAMQIAAMAPRYVSKEAIPEGEAGVSDGEILIEQQYIKDNSLTVDEHIKNFARQVGENIQIGRFHRLSIGAR